MNFPITILQGAFKDIRSTVDSIMDYATYKHSLGLEFGFSPLAKSSNNLTLLFIRLVLLLLVQ